MEHIERIASGLDTLGLDAMLVSSAPGEFYDTVLLYDDATSPRQLSECMAKRVAKGERAVAVRDIPGNWHYKEVIDMRGGKDDE